MAITGVHTLLYSSDPDALRTVLRDVFGFPHVDAGDGWLIFALPPAELGVHPAESPAKAADIGHQIALMCDDIHATIHDLRSKGVEVKGEPETRAWGTTAMLALPGGVEMMLYQPRHATAIGRSSAEAQRVPSGDPLAEVERAYISEFLQRQGQTLASVHTLPEDKANALLKAASVYASGRLTEVESRSHYVDDVHGVAEPKRRT